MRHLNNDQQQYIDRKRELYEVLWSASYVSLGVAVWLSLSLAGALDAMGLPAWVIADTDAMPQKIITFTVAFIGLRAYVKDKREEMDVND